MGELGLIRHVDPWQDMIREKNNQEVEKQALNITHRHQPLASPFTLLKNPYFDKSAPFLDNPRRLLKILGP